MQDNAMDEDSNEGAMDGDGDSSDESVDSDSEPIDTVGDSGVGSAELEQMLPFFGVARLVGAGNVQWVGLANALDLIMRSCTKRNAGRNHRLAYSFSLRRHASLFEWRVRFT